jgi:MraZ protein
MWLEVVDCVTKWKIFKAKVVIFMFIGEYQHGLDAKGRIIIPSKFRAALDEHFVITRGLDQCLFVYPKKEWETFEEKLKALPLTKRDARAFTRFFFSGANECEFDKQGRILIPNNLREYAEIEKDAVVIGVANRVEIWSKKSWEAYNQSDLLSSDSIALKMEELGI